MFKIYIYIDKPNKNVSEKIKFKIKVSAILKYVN